MIIGIPKEIKNNENRVALTPAGAQELVKRGHTVYVQATAGVNSGFADEAYTAVGAEILPTIGDVYARAEMIVKVKEPIAPEYKLIRKDQLVFTFFHFASSEPLTRAMIDSGAVCCAYETVERADRSLPLLIPMSEVAGRMSTQEGRYFLEKPRGGKGKLLGGVPGVKPAKVFVIGAGVVGTAAARTAAGTGADVTICDISLQRLTYLADVMPKNVKTLMSSEYNIREELKHADLVIGSVLIPGAKAPKLVTRDMLREMEPGSVMVDVAIDQGGCFLASHDARRPRLLCRRYPPLLRGQHSRRRALFLDACAHQRHASLRRPARRQGLAPCLQGKPRTGTGAQHRAGQSGLPARRRGLGASLRAAGAVTPSPAFLPAAGSLAEMPTWRLRRIKSGWSVFHPLFSYIWTMIRKLLLILRFYYSAMFFFCMAVSIGLAWVVSRHGPTIVPWCLLGKAAVYPLYLYVWIVQRYGDEFFYYRNLGVRRRELLGVSCGVDFILCYVLLKLTAAFLYEPL